MLDMVEEQQEADLARTEAGSDEQEMSCWVWRQIMEDSVDHCKNLGFYCG